MEHKKLTIAYFGGEPIGVPVLNELEKVGIMPSLIVCNPDRPAGRKQILTAPPVKQWAQERNIEVFQPETLKDKGALTPLTETKFDLFVVVAYNKILPTWIIELPKNKTINVHPSLLPLLRGASPIRTAILENMKETGVTIMLMDEKMDHGPILAQETITIPDSQWPIAGKVLDEKLAVAGGQLLAKTIPEWVRGDITPIEQAHENATYCGKIEKEMAELNIDPHNLPTREDAYPTLLKIKAYDGWPIAFFIHAGKRIKITQASLSADGSLVVERVIPEGKSEMSFDSFVRSL